MALELFPYRLVKLMLVRLSHRHARHLMVKGARLLSTLQCEIHGSWIQHNSQLVGRNGPAFSNKRATWWLRRWESIRPFVPSSTKCCSTRKVPCSRHILSLSPCFHGYKNQLMMPLAPKRSQACLVHSSSACHHRTLVAMLFSSTAVRRQSTALPSKRLPVLPGTR